MNLWQIPFLEYGLCVNLFEVLPVYIHIFKFFPDRIFQITFEIYFKIILNFSREFAYRSRQNTINNQQLLRENFIYKQISL